MKPDGILGNRPGIPSVRSDRNSPRPKDRGTIAHPIYAAAILLSFLNRWIGFGLYWVVALIWLVPDRRIERVIAD
jgi:uncharacterized membrane protein